MQCQHIGPSENLGWIHQGFFGRERKYFNKLMCFFFRGANHLIIYISLPEGFALSRVMTSSSYLQKTSPVVPGNGIHGVPTIELIVPSGTPSVPSHPFFSCLQQQFCTEENGDPGHVIGGNDSQLVGLADGQRNIKLKCHLIPRHSKPF